MPTKVRGPFVLPRVKQSNNPAGPRIDARNIARFVLAARVAGECKVFRAGPTTVLDGNDVVDLEGQNVERLRCADQSELARRRLFKRSIANCLRLFVVCFSRLAVQVS